MTSCKLFCHLTELLLIKVVDKTKTYELHDTCYKVEDSNEHTDLGGNVPRECRGVDRVEGDTLDESVAVCTVFKHVCVVNVTHCTHDCNCNCRTNTLSELSEEGVEGVNDTLVSATCLPLVVVDSVTHHSPRYCGVDTKTESANELTNNVNDKVKTCIAFANGDNAERACEEDACAYDVSDRTNNGELLLTILLNHLTSKRCEENDRKHCECRYKTGDACVLEVRLECNGNCCRSALHTDEHTHSCKCSTNSGTVSEEVPHSLEDVELRLLFVKSDVLLNADLCVLDHEHEADESEDTHNECGSKCLHGVKNVVIIDKHRKKDHRNHVSEKTTDGAPCGKRCTVSGIGGDKGKERTVRNVSDCVECIPYDVACYEDDSLRDRLQACSGNEYASATYDKTDRTNEYVLKELISLINALVCVYHGTDDGIVDSIPNLNDDEEEGVPCSHTHDLGPEDCHCALEGEAHVTAKVTGSICETVAHAKLAMAVSIKL